MQILTGAQPRSYVSPSIPRSTPMAASASQEPVTLDLQDVRDVAMTVGGGFVPIAGAAVNWAAMIGAGINNHKNLAMMNLAGGVANLAGTASLAGGLLFGNSTAAYVGLGLLGSSALAAGITVAAM